MRICIKDNRQTYKRVMFILDELKAGKITELAAIEGIKGSTRAWLIDHDQFLGLITKQLRSNNVDRVKKLVAALGPTQLRTWCLFAHGLIKLSFKLACIVALAGVVVLILQWAGVL